MRTDNRSQFSERARPMAALAEASSLMRLLAEPGTPGESVKAAIRRAARRAGIDTGLGKRLWYGEARRIDADTMDRLRIAADDTKALGEAINARRTILARLAAVEAALGLPDADTAGRVDYPLRRQAGAANRAVAR
jgi:hypothetical protein